MRRAALAVTAAALLAGGCGERAEPFAEREGAAPPVARAAQQDGVIARADLRVHLRALQRIARRSGGHRSAGSAGERRTSAYIAERMRAAGWRVRFERVRFPFFRLRGPSRVGDLRRARDFSVLLYSASGRVRSRVRPLDDQACTTAGLRPVRRGEIALVARGGCTYREKLMNAQRAGAGALLVVDRSSARPVSATLGDPDGIRIPVVAVGSTAASRLARTTSPITVRVNVESRHRATRNVLAETAPAADGRVAMAGAHLDSVDDGPGLNDNGSGVTALLEVAERLRARPGLRMGFWAAEEIGLYGSRAYVRGLSGEERRRIRAYVNLDMVGSPKPNPVVYDTDDEVERVLRAAYPGPEGETKIDGASDHAPFDRAGIANGGLFTGASRRSDPCYHRACDTIRNVDVPMLARMSRAAQAALTELSG